MAKENAAGIARAIEGQKPGVSPGQESPESAPGADSPPPGRTPPTSPESKKGAAAGPDPHNRAELMRQFAHLRDRDGLSFDPQLHKWDHDKGRPELTPAGLLRRKPGRKPKRRAGASSSYIPPEGGGPEAGPGGAPAEGPQPVTEADRNRTSAKVAASMWFNGLTFVFGEDAQPASAYKEREQLEAALQEHFDVHGRWSVPTWLGIAQVMGAHLGRVTSSERARERARTIGERVAATVAWLRQAAKPRAKRQAQADQAGEGDRARDAAADG